MDSMPKKYSLRFKFSRVLNGSYEGWKFNSGNYLFTTETK